MKESLFSFSFKWKSFLLLAVFGMTVFSAGAQISLRGQINDSYGNPLPQVSVTVQSDQLQSLSDDSGMFQLSFAREKTYVLTFRLTGYEAQNISIEVKKEQPLLRFILKESIETLQQVQITAKTETKKIQDQAIRATVIDLRPSYEQAATLNELMNRTSGIRIRQSGGLGANTDVSLNGFQGKAIKYFKDGVPLDYLGDGFSVAVVPPNMLQRIEVYKGVLPTALGADALGGAVNLVSRKTEGKSLETGYEMASFNTHRLSLNTVFNRKDQGAFIGMDGFFNYSDNNYKARVRATDPETRNQYETDVRLFHNAYKGHFVSLFGGLRHLGWADEVKISLNHYQNSREQQHPALMTDPYGAILSRQAAFVPELNYVKQWKEQRIRLQQFLTYSDLTIQRIDTLRGQYDWFGQFTPNPLKKGESRQPSNSSIRNGVFTSRTHVSVTLGDMHQLSFNQVYTDASRSGSDPLGPRFSGSDIDILSIPNHYRKSVTAVGLSSDYMDRKLNHQLTFKYFNFSAEGVEAYEARPIQSSELKKVNDGTFGIATALKYEWSPRHLIRASAEYATRLPDHTELFGDAIFVVPNFELRPERSLNVSLGYRFQPRPQQHLEINSFYRRTKDLILLVPIQAPYAHYENQENVQGYGIEAEALLPLTGRLSLHLNMTWQNLRLFGMSEAPGAADKENARLRNTPYLFANAGLNHQYKKWRSYAYYSFVREYYLETIPKHLEPSGFLGFGKSTINSLLVIPDQHLLSVGSSYQLIPQKLTLALEAKNVFNSRLYDNYRVQKAGQSFHLKLNYKLY